MDEYSEIYAKYKLKLEYEKVVAKITHDNDYYPDKLNQNPPTFDEWLETL